MLALLPAEDQSMAGSYPVCECGHPDWNHCGWDGACEECHKEGKPVHSFKLREHRPCTCHPDDSPPVPCERKYAFSECSQASGGAEHG